MLFYIFSKSLAYNRDTSSDKRQVVGSNPTRPPKSIAQVGRAVKSSLLYCYMGWNFLKLKDR